MNAAAKAESHRPLLFAVLALIGALAACETPQSRIRRNRALFASFPPEAQQQIREGKVDIGFSPEMVLMALGRPTLMYERTSDGADQQVWVYRQGSSAGPGFGVSLGGGIGSSVGVGGTIGVAGNGDAARDRARIVFEHGQVVEAELPS